jgi:NhaP-type Na+/H+ or K+/H+ antiporter
VYDVVLLFILAGLLLTGLRFGTLSRLARHPILTLFLAVIFGFGAQLAGLEPIDPAIIGLVAQFGLAMLAFVAAQQCRLSRLPHVSRAAFRLAGFGTPMMMLLFAGSAYILVPNLDLWAALMVGAAFALGGAPAIAGPLLSAPVADETRKAARLETASLLALNLPLLLLIDAAAIPVEPSAPLYLNPLFDGVAGFAVGGTIGLLAGRLLPLSDAELPVLPFLVGVAAFVFAMATGFQPVMATVAAGILYSEEAPLAGPVRTRLWRTGERILMPIGLFAFGFVLGPLAVAGDLLTWMMALLAVTVVRAIPRYGVLTGSSLPVEDRTFLVWFNGAPGAATAFFLLYLVGSPVGVQDEAIALGGATLILGLIATRAISRPLTSRLVQQTALAQKRRFRPA